MLDRYSQLVIRYRWAIVLLWIAVGLILPYFAPAWNSITHDGDFAYLPPESPTIRSQKLLDTAFDSKPPKSQIVVGLVRSDAMLEKEDFAAGHAIAWRLTNLFAARVLRDLEMGIVEPTSVGADAEVKGISRTQRALDLLDQAMQMIEELEGYLEPVWNEQAKGNAATGKVNREEFVALVAETFYLRAAFADRVAQTQEQHDEAAADLLQATELDPRLKELGALGLIQRMDVERFPIMDMWTWRTEIVGARLQDPKKFSRLIVMQFPTEFMAAGNIAALERVEAELEKARAVGAAVWKGEGESAPELVVSGSAAVGADMLRSSARSIRNTDWLTAFLVLLFLAVVYRSPMMVAIPMAAIYLSLQISTSLVAMFAQAAAEPNWPYWDLKVFTTTRIFVVVLLHGSGTNACLFLISRFREECGKGSDSLLAVRKSVAGVGGALLASSIATILGLSTLFFAEFGKYHYTGPVIGFCLIISTFASISLAPALLAVLGPFVFWPWPPLQHRRVELAIAARKGRTRVFGKRVAEWLVRRPALVISVVLGILIAPALQGLVATEMVSYDVLAALGRDLPSRRGTDTLRSLFEPGEAGPIVLLVSKPNLDTKDPATSEAIAAFHHAIYTNQVASVRGILDPLGDLPPNDKVSITNYRDIRARIARASQVTRDTFVGRHLGVTVLKWEVVPRQSPFSRDCLATLKQVEEISRNLLEDRKSPLYGAKLDVGGVTAALRDLESVTRSDYRNLRWIVIASVLGTLLFALRRPFVSLYIVLTVLLGFFVTMGLTYWTFAIVNLDASYLLDWRVPLFLFVILVAVGADYSVYLAARVFEEQAEHGPFTGLRRAIEQTGGVISSCGLIMAGTFISMTSGVWASAFPDSWTLPRELFGSPQDVQRGIVELGYALALGILLDTFVVRTILLPAFLASLAHWKAYRQLKRQKEDVV
jgi:RND superfamily putative drug exporter